MMEKRFVSMLLVLCIVLTLLPAQVFAAEAEPKAALNTAANPFTDIKEGQWYYDAVLYAFGNGLFSGTSSTTFSPGGTMTRGMYVTVLGRMVGADVSKYSSAPAFSDVQAGSYYAPYVAWAAEKGVTSGIGGGKFDPDGLVTRQQMASFIVRLFDTYGYTYPAATVTGTPKDIDSVAPYAKDAVLKLWACGLFAGNAGKFNPDSNASRAEAATFLMRTDRHLVESGFKQAPGEETPSNPGNGGGGSDGTYTLKFNTMGGAALADKRLPSGAKLNDLPTPYKMNEIFQGWYTDAERSKPVSATDTISGNMTLYAEYSSAEGVTEQAMSPFVSAIDVSAAFTIGITDDTGSMTAEAVKAALAYSCLTNPEFTEIRISGSDGTFTVAGNGGWQEGSTNKLELLDERLHFTGQDPTADIYNFTVQKAEVLNLQLNGDIKYLPAGSISNITQDGADVYNLSIPLATVQAGRSSTVEADNTTGSFTYNARTRSSEEIKVGDVVAIYEGTRPDQRDINADEGNYADEDVAYVVITEIEGDKYTYQNADSTDVLFTPDVLPVSGAVDLNLDDVNTLTVNKSVLDFTDAKYNGSGLDATTTIDVGDFIAFYPDGEDPSDESTETSSYAEITAVEIDGEGYVITYKAATMDDIMAAMDIYDTADIDGETLLGDTDVAALEESIVEQAQESGFAEEAAQYLAVLAMETEGFQELAGDLTVSAYGADKAKPKVENLEMSADIRTKLKHFEGLSGLRAALTISFDVVVSAGENKIVIHVEGTFEEEARLKVNVGGGAVWKWAWIFPYIADYRLNANIDVYNFTGISINAQVGTFGKDETPDLDEDDDWDNVAMQLKELIEKAEEGKETIEGIGTMGTSLADKYSAMLENESDWVELFAIELFETEGFVDPFHILCYGVGADFVVSANMNVSIGFDFFYENAKRYNFSLGLFSKTSKSDTVVLVEEKYEFTFYVMGSLGVRAGLRLEVKVGLFSLKLASIGLSAEVGAYLRMWGYFYYRLTWAASQGKQTEVTGALLLEIGIYLEIKFMAQAFKGYFSYNPTLYENEWPLWTAGKQDNVQSFAYAQAKAPAVEMKKTNYTAVLPDSAFAMSYMDMKDGKLHEKAYNDEKDFDITITNPAFSYNPKTNVVTVTPGGELSQSGEMLIVWKKQPLAFSSKAMSRTVSLDWEDLEGAFVIDFNTNGGSGIKPIVARPGTAIITPENPSKQGYVFGGWYGDAGLNVSYTIPQTMGESDVSLHAKWNPATDTKYTVLHHQQNLANERQYTLVDTEVMENGVTDSVISPAVKTYEGFTAPELKSLTILPDGSAALNYYYTRNTYTVTFSRNDIDENADDVYKYKYGATISAPKIATAGFIFDKWDKQVAEIMPAEDITYTASWTPDPNTKYRVEYYLQNTLGETYVLTNIKTLTGETDTAINVDSHIQEFDGLTHSRTVILNTDATSPKIDKNGKSIIKLYYDRNKYDLALYVDGELLRTDNIAYGATLLEPGKPTKQGYVFDGWYSDAAMTTKYQFGHTMTMETVKLYGKYTPSADTQYRVEHYVEQLSDEYTFQKSDEKTGMTAEVLTLSTLTDSAIIIDGGITYKEAGVAGEIAETANILADGSLVVKLYYQRESHMLTFQPENGEGAITREGKYGSIVTPPTVTKPGFEFAGWSPAAPTTMPVADASYTAQWTAGTNTAYKVEHYWQNANDEGYTLHETTPHTGTTGQTVTAVAKSYESFSLNESAPGAVKTGAVAADGNLILKLYYDRTQFTITFDAGEGALKGGVTQTLRHGATVTTAAPERTGYGFGGWYLDEGCATAFNGTMPTENTTVYAKWTAGEVSYTVYHYVMDTAGAYPATPTATDSKTASTGTELTLSALKNSGYEVENGIVYKEAKSGEAVAETAAVLADGSLAVKLYYERKSYTLAWNLNGGTQAEVGTAAGTVYYDATLTAPTAKMTGYIQNGWAPAFTGRMPAADVTYTAQWSTANYNITYLDVGGAGFSGIHGANHPATHTYGAATTLVAPTKANYTFGGWFIDANGTGTAVTAIESDIHETVTLYAKWSPVSYGISYHMNDGTNALGNPAAYSYGTAVNLQNPTRAGYTFAGWYANEALTAQVTNPAVTAADSGDKAFYAKWELTSYTITYQFGVADVTNWQNPTSYTIETEAITLKSGSKYYYRFDGWFADAAYTQPITQIEKGSTGNKTIYGKLTEVGMKIPYALGEGGVNHESNPEYYLLGQGEVNLSVPTREGYTFEMWIIQDSYSTSYNVTKLNYTEYPKFAFSLKAIWTPNTITVTYDDMQPDDFNYHSTPYNALLTTATVGEEKLLSLNIFPKANTKHAGKQLLGFYTTPDCSGEPVTNLGNFKTNTTLYAKWADGTKENPYLIRNDIDFSYQDGVVRSSVTNAAGKCYLLVQSFTTTIARPVSAFYGNMLETAHTITYEAAAMGDFHPLFGTIYGTVRNIKIKITTDTPTSSISPAQGADRAVGLLAAETAPGSLVTNCQVESARTDLKFTHSNSANLHAGALVGKHQGVIDNVSVNADFSVTSGKFGIASIGGIAGTVTGGGVIRNATVQLALRQKDGVEVFSGLLGGITGRILEDATIENCVVRLQNPNTVGAVGKCILTDGVPSWLNDITASYVLSTGIIAGHVLESADTSKSIKVNNIRAVHYDTDTTYSGGFPVAGVYWNRSGDIKDCFQYLYITGGDLYSLIGMKYTAPSKDMIYRVAGIASAETFPTTPYLYEIGSPALSEDSCLGYRTDLTVKVAMNNWVNKANATNPGKYKLWD